MRHIHRPSLFLAALCLPMLLSAQGGHSEQARQILAASGTRGGVVVHVGCGDGRLTAALGQASPCVVHGLAGSAQETTDARAHVRRRGLYGRVSVATWNGDRLPYSRDLVNLVVVGGAMPVDREEAMRVLAPLGVLCVREGDSWTTQQKPWPEDIDEWTHHCHGPDGNPVANDLRVGPPRQLRWIQDPPWMRAHDTDSSLSCLVTSRGRVFYMVDDAPISLPGDNDLPDKWHLTARDAFNGVLLWRIPVKDWGWRAWKQSWVKYRPDNFPINLHRRVVADGDRLYATMGYRAPVSEIDAATGKVLRVFPGTEGTCEILVHNRQLLLTVPAEDKLKLMAVDLSSGTTAWETKSGFAGTDRESKRQKLQLSPVLNAAVDDHVICLLDGSDIVCLSRTDGKPVWRTGLVATSPGRGKTRNPASPVLKAGLLIVRHPVVVYSTSGKVTALSTHDGSLLWSRDTVGYQGLWFSWKDVFVIDGLVWTWSGKRGREPTHATGYDLETGEVRRNVPVGNVFNVNHHHRCYRNKATPRYILASRRGTEFVDLQGGEHSVHNWIRGICHLGMMPANGLQYAPPTPCKCYVNEKLNGLYAATATPSPAPEEGSRLVRGPAFGAPRETRAATGDWPTFRGNAERSCAAAAIPTDPSQRWRTNLGSKISAPVVAGGRVFIAAPDEHAVHCLDAASGRQLWQFTADGRVDSPPTWDRGHVYFGSRSGHVYSVRAADGALAWRFRAASAVQLIGAFDQLESAWPAHGSVLIRDNVLYAAAGRLSYLDGGIDVFALDPGNGNVLHRAALRTPYVDVTDPDWHTKLSRSGAGTLNDILQAAGEFIYLRNSCFTRDLEPGEALPRIQARGGFLDSSFFQRAFTSYEEAMPNHSSGKKGGPIDHSVAISMVLAHDADTVYGVRMFDAMKLLNNWNFFTPGGQGYTLFAIGREDRKTKWSCRVPIRATALVAGRGALVLAGPPDVAPDEDPWGAFEGRRGGVLRVVSADSGEALNEARLPSPTVHDGIAAASGELFAVLENGDVLCLGR